MQLIAHMLNPDVSARRSHVAGAQQPRSPYIYAVGGNDGAIVKDIY
eukprot:SAG31_NODE_1284_length_9010_cov_56.116934_6_plen_46_part_00